MRMARMLRGEVRDDLEFRADRNIGFTSDDILTVGRSLEVTKSVGRAGASCDEALAASECISDVKDFSSMTLGDCADALDYVPPVELEMKPSNKPTVHAPEAA